ERKRSGGYAARRGTPAPDGRAAQIHPGQPGSEKWRPGLVERKEAVEPRALMPLPAKPESALSCRGAARTVSRHGNLENTGDHFRPLRRANLRHRQVRSGK